MRKLKGSYPSLAGQTVLAIIEQHKETPEVIAALALSANWDGYMLDPVKGIVKDPAHPVCDVTGCDERKRCLDVECPNHCALYRMKHKEK